jgi:hypothetical protein
MEGILLILIIICENMKFDDINITQEAINAADRKYDKGENRYKHSGKHADARMKYENGALVGKCPKGFTKTVALELVKTGFSEFRNTTNEKPYRIWNYHNGAVYAASSQDGGMTWHGYPSHLKDRVPRGILRQLEARACEQGEKQRIHEWWGKQWDK